mgnify:CR=1 FL=1
MIARRLVKGEAAQFHALWLDGLRRFPQAFLLTEQEAQATTLDHIEIGIGAGHHWGVWRGDEFVALASMRRGGVARLRHTADIGPFYVRADLHGQGIAAKLLNAMLASARADGVLQVELCVDATNTAAQALYHSAGFTIFGTRPRSVIVDGIARDDHLMVCKLDSVA